MQTEEDAEDKDDRRASNPKDDNTVSEEIKEVGVVPLDGNDPLIYSKQVSTSPYSFLDEDAKYNENSPPPCYIPYATLSKPKATAKLDILKGLEINDKGILQCTDPQMLEKSKGILTYVIKEIAKCIFTGRGVVGISLPVRIFEPRSALERVLDGFSFAPEYLNRACKTRDSVERMKLVTAFVVSGMYMRANPFKPFNPILGETLEGKYSDGTKIYMEHTSHHPPISNYLIEGPKDAPYTFHGNNEFVGNIKSRGNILNILFKGPNTITFPDGEEITFYNHTNKVKGLLSGAKLISMDSILTVVNEEKGLKTAIFMEPKAKEVQDDEDPNYFEGVLYYSDGTPWKKDPDMISKISDLDEEI